MWQLLRARLGPDAERWRVVSGAQAEVPFAAMASLWAADAGFREFWISGLRAVPFDAYAWECRPVRAANADRPFECVLLASPALARMPPDPTAFAGHFRPGEAVAGFANLGGDAWLVAPCPGGREENLAHLASFTATAPAERQQALWRSVGQALEPRIGASPLWLSTAGLGVAWLHVRLDSRPKYYRHAAYVKA